MKRRQVGMGDIWDRRAKGRRAGAEEGEWVPGCAQCHTPMCVDDALGHVRPSGVFALAVAPTPAKGLAADEGQRGLLELDLSQWAILLGELVLVSTSCSHTQWRDKDRPTVCTKQTNKGKSRLVVSSANFGARDLTMVRVWSPRNLHGLAGCPDSPGWQGQQLAAVVAMLRLPVCAPLWSK